MTEFKSWLQAAEEKDVVRGFSKNRTEWEVEDVLEEAAARVDSFDTFELFELFEEFLENKK